MRAGAASPHPSLARLPPPSPPWCEPGITARSHAAGWRAASCQAAPAVVPLGDGVFGLAIFDPRAVELDRRDTVGRPRGEVGRPGPKRPACPQHPDWPANALAVPAAFLNGRSPATELSRAWAGTFRRSIDQWIRSCPQRRSPFSASLPPSRSSGNAPRGMRTEGSGRAIFSTKLCWRHFRPAIP
jgi:hypothetical protein